ncbi:hypothetical protein U3516DRAFT_655669 [Neocallimastix sp. 'constans']|jgi:hypothetical protein
MFAKNYLSLVALLFVNSYISSVSAAWIDDCTTISGYSELTSENSSCEVAAHCKVGDLIMGVDNGSTANCKKTLNGVFAFNEEVGTLISLVNTNIADPDIKSNVVLYNCDGTTCVKTVGIIRDSTANYVVAAEGGASEATSFETTSCATGKIDTSDNNVLCLTASIKATNANPSYIMENVADNAFGTGGDNRDKSIVIKTATNIFALDNLIKGDEYCVTTTTNVLTGTLEDFFGNNPATCDAYYSCDGTTHLCSDVTSTSTCTRNAEITDDCVPKSGGASCSGYYITSDAEGTTLLKGNEGSLSGTLWSCNGADPCTKKSSLVGYFPNASDYKVTISYIQCKFDQIQGEAIVNACTAIKANDIEAATDCSAVKAGALLSGNKICVDDNTANAVPLAASNESNNGDYFINDKDNHIFIDSSKNAYHVIITISNEEVTLKTITSPEKRYKYAVKNKIYEKATENASGICQDDASKALIEEFKSDACDSDKVYYYSKQ